MIAKIYREGRDFVVDADGMIHRGMKISISKLPDGRYSIRVWDPAFTLGPKPSRARMYHADVSLIADRIEDYRI